MNEGIPKSESLDFDGHAEILVESTEILAALQADPYYERVIKPDEDELLDQDSIKRRIGWEEVWVKYGKAVDHLN